MELSSKGKLAIALAAGAIWPLSLSPLALWWLVPFSLVGLFFLLENQPAKIWFRYSFFYFLAAFGVGVSWVYASIANFSQAGVVGGAIMTLIFVGGLALIQSALFYVIRRWVLPKHTGALVVALTYVLAEWLRGWLFTGFPWMTIGDGAVDSPLKQLLPFFGSLGVTAWWALVVALLYQIVVAKIKANRAKAQQLPYQYPWVLPALGLMAFIFPLFIPYPSGIELEPVEFGLVQANVPQEKKWEPEYRQSTLDTYVEGTGALQGAKVVIWPETAVPAFEHVLFDEFFAPLDAKLAEYGMTVITGVPIMDLEKGYYYNAVAAYGEAQGQYYKTRLVPFTEFIPFADWLDVLGVPMSTFTPGDSNQPLFDVAGIKIGASVCYEVAYDFVMRNQAMANVLVTVSNDAWFGNSFAPYQHLQIARTRAVELGRPMVRATNTGISAFIDHHGNVQKTLGLNERGVLAQTVVPTKHYTMYALMGNWPVLILLFGWLGFLLLSRRRLT